MNDIEQSSASHGSGFHNHHEYREDTDMNTVDLQSIGRGDGFGGGGMLAGLLVGALLSRRDGVFGAEAAAAAASPIDIATLNGVNNIAAAVPTVALQGQNALLEQTNEITSQISQGVLAILNSNGAVKDAVQGSAVALLAAGNSQTKEILAAVQSVKDQASGYRISDLERQLTVAQLNERDSGIHRRLDSVEVNVSQNVSQSQQQGQVQAQLQTQGMAIAQILRELAENTQLSRATAANTNFIVGNQGPTATGAQTATPTSTNVSSR